MSDYVELSIDDIELDRSNPRIANYLDLYDEDELTSDTMALLLGTTSDSCASLRESIKENGGIVYVVDSDLIVNARRDYFEQNEAHYDLLESFKEWSTSQIREIRKVSCQRTLSEKKKAIIETEKVDDINKFANGEADYIDREESEEVSEIDFMDKLSWILNQKQGKTKYMALNINNRLTNEQKKILEQVFDIVKAQYRKKEAEEFINTMQEQEYCRLQRMWHRCFRQSLRTEIHRKWRNP